MPPHPPSSKSPPSILAPTPATYPHSPAHHTLHWDRIPLWMQIDPYIRLGYRHQLDSLSLCIHSLFYPHNDLVNTWSHLLPALIYLTLLLPNTSYPLPPHHHQGQLIEHLASPQDIAVIRLYILGTAFCLLASVRPRPALNPKTPFVSHIPVQLCVKLTSSQSRQSST